MLEVALFTALVIAVLTVPPVTKPVLPSVTVPVPSFSLHLEASSVEMLEASLLAFALNLESNPLLMLEVALFTALVIAVLTVPPVTRPVLPSVTVPVPNFSLHLEASSVEILEASLLALLASLVSTAVDNSVILGAIAPVMASLDTFTL